MAVQEVSSVEESKGEFLIKVRNELTDGNFDEAKRLEREQLIPPHIITSIANSVFEGLIKSKQYKLAITLGKKYSFTPERIEEVILLEFRNIISQGKIEDAIEWGLRYHLPGYEISRAAIRGIENAVMDGDVKKAVKLKGEYSITEEQIGTFWQKGYDKAFKNEKYFDAALLSREFGSSERKTLLTASKALKNFIKIGQFINIIDIENEFHFFNDIAFGLLGDDEAKAAVEAFLDFLSVCVKNNDGNTLVKVVGSTRVLYGEYVNHHLKGLVHMSLKRSIEIHGNLMKKDKYKDAHKIMSELSLFEERVPIALKRQVLDQALEFHNRVLTDADYEAAKKVKDEYQLIGIYSPAELIDSVQKTAVKCISSFIRKGEFNKANFIIEEYNIPASEVSERSSEDLKYLLSSEMFDVAFNALLKFKINSDDEELKEIAAKAFVKCMEKGYYEIAADLGYVFEIKNPDVRKAAKIVWDRLMDNEDYSKARVMKKKHRLSRKDTQNLAKQAYDLNIEKNKIDAAQKIRADYGVNIGILAWIIEVIKSIFKMFFK